MPPGPAPAGQAADQRPDEVVVILDRSQGSNVAFAIAQQYRLVRLEGEVNALIQAQVQRYRIPDRRSVAAVVASMQGDARILVAQPNYIHALQGGGRAEAMIGLQYAPDRLQLPSAHEIARGRNVLIAVIDSRVDVGHRELAGAVAADFDAVRDGNGSADTHGTAVAGIIASRGRFRGVAPEAKVLAIRAFFQEQGRGTITTTFILMRALDWARTRQARVFNLSFAGPRDKAIELGIEALQNGGAVLIAAAGNGGPGAAAAFPAAYDGVIAVTAVDKVDRLYGKAHRGSYISVSAPGVDVLAPVPGNGYDFKSGTSFAAAHVSGMVALLMERNPSLSGDEALRLLSVGAVDLGPRGKDEQFGAGRVDALASVRAGIGAVPTASSEQGARPAVHQPAAADGRR